jgi:uncharacterized protein YuzE
VVRLVEGRGPAKHVVLDDDDASKPIGIDLDGEGRVVGFELLSAARCCRRSFSAESDKDRDPALDVALVTSNRAAGPLWRLV